MAWAALIALLSSDSFSGDHTRSLLLPLLRTLLPGASPESLRWLHDVVRKTAHPAEYAVLGWLVWRALEQPARRATAAVLLALVASTAYAALDELHQAFVPSRTPAVADVALDALGAAVGIGLRACVRRARSARRPRRSG